MFKRLLIATGLVLAAHQAQASLLLEPYVGYDSDTFKVTANGFGDLTYGVSGLNVGARVGLAMPLFFIAADYSMGTLNSKVDSQPVGFAAEAPSVSRSSLFGVVGAKLMFVQAYAGYGFINDWTFKNSAVNGGDTTFKGSAIKVGAGFTGIPFLAVNLEYMMSTFDKYKDSAGDFSLGTSTKYRDATASSIMLSVSAPFRL